MLSNIEIKNNLKFNMGGVLTFDTLVSTSDYLKENAQNTSIFLVAASHQTGGRGRHGKTFYSPKGAGVYFSFILRPKKTEEALNFLTVISAVALKEEIQDIYKKEVGIKWVNDLYYNGRKCAGILSEAHLNATANSVEYVVVGIGVNLNEPVNGYPDDLKDIAISLSSDVENSKNRLIYGVVNRFMDYYVNFQEKKLEVVEKYRKYSMLIGKTVNIVGTKKTVACVGVDDECRLVVKNEYGTEEVLNAGEVSLCIR